MRAKEAFEKMGRNVMTPNVIDYYDLPDAFVELSRGEGIEHDPLYGVTVLDLNGNLDRDRSRLFYNQDKATEYIVQLGFDGIKAR